MKGHLFHITGTLPSDIDALFCVAAGNLTVAIIFIV